MPAKIPPSTARDTVQEITKEIHALEPSTPITLYEVDISEIKKNLHLGTSTTIPHDFLRFHNMEALGQQTIYFKQDSYHPMPIQTEGFELNSDGSMPRPTLTFVSILGITDQANQDAANPVERKDNFQSLKRAILELDNLIGAKVTRYRTFLKYLDDTNNFEGVGEFAGINPEFPRDIYFVERKIEESKSVIKLELSSVLDLQNFKLPSRLCLASRCPWNYRGHGCAYEYDANDHTDPNLGDPAKQKELFGGTVDLPKYAPPVADDQDELIAGFGNKDIEDTPAGEPYWIGYKITDTHNRISGEYDSSTSYPTGAIVFTQKHNIRYYYVSKGNLEMEDGDALGWPLLNIPPPDSTYWYGDRCSKSIAGCKIRHGAAGAAENDDPDGPGEHLHLPGEVPPPGHAGHPSRIKANTFLPFGGFPGTNTKTSQR